MAKGTLNQSEIDELKQNPYVLDVSATRITYTEEFKQHFMREYNNGKKPTPIFRDAGFDTTILGPKRIERATARWKSAYAKGRIEL